MLNPQPTLLTSAQVGWISDHLHEFLPGLSAVLSFASLSVRPALYSIYENYVVHISHTTLRPVLKSLILSLLPGIEDETSEDYERAFALMEGLQSRFTPPTDKEAVDSSDGFFWQCLFLATVSNPTRRQGALNFLTQKLPIFRSERKASITSAFPGSLTTEAERAISPEPGLLIRSFISGLSDPQLLIQRGFLDLLVTNIPLDSPLLQQHVGSEDLDRLITAVMQVLLRREMSLNRRLWSWFLGPEPKTDGTESRQSGREEATENHDAAQFRYFSRFGQAPLERCLLNMFQSGPSNPAERARPFRICLSLMDRWEIGGSIIPRIFLPALRSAYRYSLIATPENTNEVLRSAGLFFDGIEASLIWADLLSLMQTGFAKKAATDDLPMLAWIIRNFNIKDEEMLLVHVPYAACYFLALLQTSVPQQPTTSAVAALDIVSIMLEMAPDRAFVPPAKKTGASTASASEATELRETLENFYRSTDQSTRFPFDGSAVFAMLSHFSASLALTALQAQAVAVFSRTVFVIAALNSKSSVLPALRDKAVFAGIADTMNSLADNNQTLAFSSLSSMVTLLSIFQPARQSQSHNAAGDSSQLEAMLINQFWHYLSLEQPKYHVEAVKSIWQLQDIVAPVDILQSSLTGLLRPRDQRRETSCDDFGATVGRFAVLWNHTIAAPSSNAKTSVRATPRRGSSMPTMVDSKKSLRRQQVLFEPLMMLLDMLDEYQEAHADMVKNWLHTLPTLEVVFNLHFDLLRTNMQIDEDGGPAPALRLKRSRHDSIRLLDYVFRHLQNILRRANDWIWHCLDNMMISNMQHAEQISGAMFLAEQSYQILSNDEYTSNSLRQKATNVLRFLLLSPCAPSLKWLDLDTRITAYLIKRLSDNEDAMQSSLLPMLSLALQPRTSGNTTRGSTDRRPSSSTGQRQATSQPSPTPTGATLTLTPTTQLVKCLQLGFSSPSSRIHLDKWVTLLGDILPVLGDALLVSLIPLEEALCAEVYKAHEELVGISNADSAALSFAPEAVILALLDALQSLLVQAHDLLEERQADEPVPRTPVQSKGLLGNVTAGVFNKTDAAQGRTQHDSGRLTVVLAFQDAVRVCSRLWTWAIRHTHHDDFDKMSAATSAYNALRVRNRARNLLEYATTVETLESLEVIASAWCQTSDADERGATLNLLHIIHDLRPKVVVSTILDAIACRTNMTTLPLARQSCQTTDLTALDATLFLSAYLRSTEDDAMDEIWSDCMSFLRDVLSNPLPYRQVLPPLLSVITLLAQKIENTNFGDQRKMRRDLGDVFTRILTATFSAIPSGALESQTSFASDEELVLAHRSLSLPVVLSDITEHIDAIVDGSDKATVVINNIVMTFISPILHSRGFPVNVTPDILSLFLKLAKKAPSAKPWKKELADVFADPKFLSTPLDLMQTDWFPLLRQWCLYDKERIPEILSRLTAPSSAGIMFGVGASTARLEADRKAQLNLRRLCLLLLASAEDTFATNLRAIEEKLAELFEASSSSSPSMAIKSELFMVCRTLVLSLSTVHLASVWPLLNHKLQMALLSLLSASTNDSGFSNASLLQACKLLDLLVAISPDEFQLHEWLYICDTIDAGYQPPNWTPSALSDHIAENSVASEEPEDALSSVTPTTIASGMAGRRQPLLRNSNLPNQDDIKAMPREDFVRTVLKPFFSQLSLHAYEGFYSLVTPDSQLCRRSLLEDVLDSSTIVGLNS